MATTGAEGNLNQNQLLLLTCFRFNKVWTFLDFSIFANERPAFLVKFLSSESIYWLAVWKSEHTTCTDALIRVLKASTRHAGTRFSTCAYISQAPPTEPNWSAIVKAEKDALYTHHTPLHLIDSQHHFPGSFSCSYKERKQFPFLQDGKAAFSRTAVEASICQPLLNTVPSVESSSSSSSSKLFSDGLTQAINSECALSLLSSPTQTSSISVDHMLPTNRIPVGQPLVPSLQYSSLNPYSGSPASGSVLPTEFSCSGAEDEQAGGVLVSDTDLHCQGMFQIGGEGANDGASPSLHFSWQ